jgi:hypothetical protein
MMIVSRKVDGVGLLEEAVEDSCVDSTLRQARSVTRGSPLAQAPLMPRGPGALPIGDCAGQLARQWARSEAGFESRPEGFHKVAEELPSAGCGSRSPDLEREDIQQALGYAAWLDQGQVHIG